LEIILAFVIGGLFAAGLYMMLRRSLVKLVIGLGLLTNAINLLIFTAAQLTRARSPIIPAGESFLKGPYADPLPQAFILTAIVISFGVTAFAVGLAYRAYTTIGTDDVDEIEETETP
jgi:multicomponent Na+:H+ antiporter subunit C